MTLREIFYLPINASSHGHEIDMMMYLVHFLMLILFVGWGAYLIFACVRFSKKFHPKADYIGVKSHVSSKIEVGVVLLEAILLIGFSIPFWARQVNAFPDRPDAVELRVVAEQFAWNVHYPGKDGVFGKTGIEYFDKQANPLGVNPNDPFGKDDFTTINQLNLPVGRPAIIHLSSKDVLHSFALPVMRVKQDVIPGLSIPTWFTPTKTGKFEIACAQLCGLGHYSMRGFLTIMTNEKYEEWASSNSTSASSGGEGGGDFDDFWN